MPPRRDAPWTARSRSAFLALALAISWVVPAAGQGLPQAARGQAPAGITDQPRPDERGAPAMDEAMRAVVAGNTRFALDLYARLREDGRPGNLFYAPASLSTALAMAYAGARGPTAAEMAEVLHLDAPPETLHPAFARLRATWEAEATGGGARLSVANRLWGQQGFDFRPEFLAVTRDQYGAELAVVDFRRQVEAARTTINAWVAQQTAGKIAELIPPGALDTTARLVLTNAVYFKGAWSSPFRPDATREEPFTLTDGRRVPVPLMHRTGRYRFWAGEGLKALELPYGRGDLAMLVLLPDAADGLAELESRLTPEALARWTGGLRSQEVIVALPRFTITARFELARTLGAMGMSRAFSPNEADFTGMSTEEQLCLSAVLHQAFVDVNEEGTEAAAATAIGVVATSAAVPRPPVEFRADHPFVFLIRDTRTGSLLFLGRLVQPAG